MEISRNYRVIQCIFRYDLLVLIMSVTDIWMDRLSMANAVTHYIA